MKSRKCKNCGETKPITEYHINKCLNGRTYYRHECKVCYQRIKKAYRYKVAEYINNIKENSCCSKCGYSKETHESFSHRALEFHHPQDNKEFAIGNAVSKGVGLERIKKEIDKCVILCARCHAEIHHN